MPYPCPACSESREPAAQVGSVAICSACGASYAIGIDGIRRATSADTTALTDVELQTLRKARGRKR